VKWYHHGEEKKLFFLTLERITDKIDQG